VVVEGSCSCGSVGSARGIEGAVATIARSMGTKPFGTFVRHASVFLYTAKAVSGLHIMPKRSRICPSKRPPSPEWMGRVIRHFGQSLVWRLDMRLEALRVQGAFCKQCMRVFDMVC
jgi:hypothetical protein